MFKYSAASGPLNWPSGPVGVRGASVEVVVVIVVDPVVVDVVGAGVGVAGVGAAVDGA